MVEISRPKSERNAAALCWTVLRCECEHKIPIRMTEVGLKQAVELSGKLNLYAYDACVLACAINQRAPLLTLDGGLRGRARKLKLDVLEANLR